jgi:hypothetical protein
VCVVVFNVHLSARCRVDPPPPDRIQRSRRGHDGTATDGARTTHQQRREMHWRQEELQHQQRGQLQSRTWLKRTGERPGMSGERRKLNESQRLHMQLQRSRRIHTARASAQSLPDSAVHLPPHHRIVARPPSLRECGCGRRRRSARMPSSCSPHSSFYALSSSLALSLSSSFRRSPFLPLPPCSLCSVGCSSLRCSSASLTFSASPICSRWRSRSATSDDGQQRRQNRAAALALQRIAVRTPRADAVARSKPRRATMQQPVWPFDRMSMSCRRECRLVRRSRNTLCSLRGARMLRCSAILQRAKCRRSRSSLRPPRR